MSAVSLTQLKAEIPDFNGPAPALEDRARGVLHLLLDGGESGTRTASDGAGTCPNCDGAAESLSSPYCCEACRERAAFVRQFRAALNSGAILAPDKQIAFGQKLWWILGGGLPFRESLIPESAKRQVARRCDGKCEMCGAPMTAVENFGSGCNRPLHLRAVCPGCSMTKPFGDPAFTQSPLVVDLLIDFRGRIFASKPVRACDDPEAWDWRAFLAQRKAKRLDLLTDC
jgi:hypothetical protein